MADGKQPKNVIANAHDQQNVSLQCPKLTSKSYSTWSIMARTILGAYGLADAIDPVSGGAFDNRKNQTAMAILFQSLLENILLQVAKYGKANEVWEAIVPNNCYQSLDDSRIQGEKIDRGV